MKKSAGASTLAGTVRVIEYGSVKVHLYTSPEDGLLVNTLIVEGPTKLIIFDGQFSLPHAEEAAAYAKGLAKPVDRIILSHIHLDHWGGLSAMTEHFPEAPVYGLPGIAEYLRAMAKIVDARKPVFGDKIKTAPRSRAMFYRRVGK